MGFAIITHTAATSGMVAMMPHVIQRRASRVYDAGIFPPSAKPRACADDTRVTGPVSEHLPHCRDGHVADEQHDAHHVDPLEEKVVTRHVPCGGAAKRAWPDDSYDNHLAMRRAMIETVADMKKFTRRPN